MTGRTESASSVAVLRFVVVVVPVAPFLLRDQIARVRKRRHPASIDEHRVPADVIDMQMRAQHGVDRFARIAGRREIRQETTSADDSTLGMLRSLSLPMQVSTTMRRLPVSTTSACTLMISLPCSVMKCGFSHVDVATGLRRCIGQDELAFRRPLRVRPLERSSRCRSAIDSSRRSALDDRAQHRETTETLARRDCRCERARLWSRCRCRMGSSDGCARVFLHAEGVGRRDAQSRAISRRGHSTQSIRSA